MIRRGVSDRTLKDPVSRIGTKVKETKVESMVIINARIIMSEIGIITTITTSTGVIMVTEMIEVDPMFHLKIVKLLLGMVEVVWCELRM